MRVLVIAPAYDEQGKIGRVVQSVLENRATFEGLHMLVVDDGSTDDTALEARSLGAEVVSHASNLGVGAAIRTGVNFAHARGYDVACVISGDDQHDATELPLVVGPVVRGEVDLVQGSRYIAGGQVENPRRFRGALTRLGSAGTRAMFGIALTDLTNGLRAFRVALLDELDIDLSSRRLDGYELEPYLLLSLINRGARWREVGVTVKYSNTQGYTKMRPVKDWWRLARPLFALRMGLWT